MARGDWYVDAKEIQQRMIISKSFFYDHIRNDPRMIAIERKISKNFVRYPTEKAKEICEEILMELSQ
ncbi:hypothetical protein [Macrococcus armenti]|uniref:hypothetical protein n=1 Tax=Macrococcus armenti TaxID=2875764 RepID=UPI001CD3D0BF|nr:hypothetical protein [Macrococcus armenti]UBH10635.1 hypothetical protein LAU38_10410 [Macrococcus armenti]